MRVSWPKQTIQILNLSIYLSFNRGVTEPSWAKFWLVRSSFVYFLVCSSSTCICLFFSVFELSSFSLYSARVRLLSVYEHSYQEHSWTYYRARSRTLNERTDVIFHQTKNWQTKKQHFWLVFSKIQTFKVFDIN